MSLWTIPSFLLAIAILIAVHEYGHYKAALLSGVRVLRFSIGFGKPVWKKTRARDGVEFVLGWIPLGGYVRMLDEREGPVEPQERHRAFNRQPLHKRFFIVAAGPLANLGLAVALYAWAATFGQEQAAAVLSQPPAGSAAQRAGLVAGDRVLAAQTEAGDWVAVSSFEDLRWRITQALVAAQPLRLQVLRAGSERTVALDLTDPAIGEVDAEVFHRLGLGAPFSEARIGEVMPAGAAQRAGLRPGDRVLSVDRRAVTDAQDLRRRIREFAAQDPAQPQQWVVERGGESWTVAVRPDIVHEGGTAVGRIGAYVGAPPERVWVRLAPGPALVHGFQQTWDTAGLTVRMLGKMLLGEASWRNIGGPITIADQAGRTAQVGIGAYLVFLALVSVSLGVLNLLPLPVLDGGHLMYYLFEGLMGRPISELWADRLQRGGIAILVALMSVALFNDLSRFWG